MEPSDNNTNPLTNPPTENPTPTEPPFPSADSDSAPIAPTPTPANSESTSTESNPTPMGSNPLPPDTPKPRKKNSKLFIIIFSILSIVIIAIIIIIIVLNNQTTPATDDTDSRSPSTGLPEEELQTYYDFQDNLENLKNQASSMLNEETPDIAGIHELYFNAINNYFGKNEVSNALYCLTSSTDFFINAKLYEEALRMYDDVDLSKFDEITQGTLYGEAYDIAAYLNNTEKMDYYNQKIAGLNTAGGQNTQL